MTRLLANEHIILLVTIVLKFFFKKKILTFRNPIKIIQVFINLTFHAVPDHHAVGVYVVVNFLAQVISVFLLFLGMVMYANEVETKEK